MKTLFKLSAIASVAMALVACGGGGESGGGGSVSAPALVKQVPPTDPQPLTPARVLALSVDAIQAAPAQAAVPAVQAPPVVAQLPAVVAFAAPAPALPAPVVAPVAPVMPEPVAALPAPVVVSAPAPAAALPAPAPVVAPVAPVIPEPVATPAPAPVVVVPAPAPVVVPAGDWTLGTATVDRDVSPAFGNRYGTESDLGLAHAAGWKGQNTVMLTQTTNLSGASSDNFNVAVSLAAPRANSSDYGNVTVANASASYVAFITTATNHSAHNPSFFLNTAANMPGVVVKSDVAAIGATATYVVGSRTATIVNNALVVGTAPAVGDISFNGVNTGDATKNAGLTQQDKVAYISGSVSVVQSKFVNLTNVETVRYMDSTTEAGRIFKLGNTLSPRIVR